MQSAINPSDASVEAEWLALMTVAMTRSSPGLRSMAVRMWNGMQEVALRHVIEGVISID